MQAIFKYGRFWSITQYVLIILFSIAAVLNMLHLHIYFLTTHAADLSGPAFLYILSRKLWQQGSRRFPTGLVGRTPEITGSAYILASIATEISQKYYPHGIFPGTFDPWDIVAYITGVSICYILEKTKVGMVQQETSKYY